MLVKKVFPICLLMLTTLVALARQGTPPNSPAECTQAFFEALSAKDAPALRALLTTDFNMVSFDGNLVDGGTLTAVSYTHLDVYKRQGTSRLVRNNDSRNAHHH